VPAISVAIAKGGTIVFSQGFGFVDAHAREKVTADSLFRIASNSKAITASSAQAESSVRLMGPSRIQTG
jgi:CubicO group peptidase (beta-lactamase class C family)